MHHKLIIWMQDFWPLVTETGLSVELRKGGHYSIAGSVLLNYCVVIYLPRFLKVLRMVTAGQKEGAPR